MSIWQQPGPQRQLCPECGSTQVQNIGQSEFRCDVCREQFHDPAVGEKSCPFCGGIDLERKVGNRRDREYEEEYRCGTCGRHFDNPDYRQREHDIGSRQQRIPREELEDDLRRVTDEVGHRPNTKEYQEHGEYSVHPFYDRFEGSWDEVVAAIVDTEPEKA